MRIFIILFVLPNYCSFITKVCFFHPITSIYYTRDSQTVLFQSMQYKGDPSSVKKLVCQWMHKFKSYSGNSFSKQHRNSVLSLIHIHKH